MSRVAECPGAKTDSDLVVLAVPAETAYLGVLRTAAAGLAARLHFTLDEIEDLRIAVDEACAMLIRLTTRAGTLHCQFAVTVDELGVEMAVLARPGVSAPATSSFAWRVLASLTSAARAEIDPSGRAVIALTARRATPGR